MAADPDATDLPTKATLMAGTPEADGHTPTPRGTAPVCRCQKYQRIAAAHALRESAGGDPALLMRGLVNVLAGHLERHHPEIRGVQMAAEEAEYRGILGL